MKIGSTIPIATGSYQTGAATALVSSLVNTQFQYQDVGVNIEVTPTVHFDRDVTLKIKIEVTAQSGSVTISGVTEPILSQRVAEQTIRLREGEANILGGIQEQQIQDNWSGIPGLSSIPILRYLFGSKDKIRQDDEIVFLVVPHVVRSQDLTPTNLRRSIPVRERSRSNCATLRAAVPQPAVPTPPGGRGTSRRALGRCRDRAPRQQRPQLSRRCAQPPMRMERRLMLTALRPMRNPPPDSTAPGRQGQPDVEFAGNGDQRHHVPGSGGSDRRNGCFLRSLADSI